MADFPEMDFSDILPAVKMHMELVELVPEQSARSASAEAARKLKLAKLERSKAGLQSRLTEQQEILKKIHEKLAEVEHLRRSKDHSGRVLATPQVNRISKQKEKTLQEIRFLQETLSLLEDSD